MNELKQPHFDEENILSYLLTEDYPDWRRLRACSTFSEKWVVFFLKRSRPIPRASVEEIYGDKLFRKNYQVNLHLVRCKTSPPHVAMNLVHTLRYMDLFWSLRLPFLPGAVRQKIELQLIEVLPRLTVGEQVTLAKQAPRPLIRHMRLLQEPRVIRALLLNYFFTYEDALFLANYLNTCASTLEELARSQKWLVYHEVKMALLRHERLPRSLILPLAKTMKDHELQQVLRHPNLPLYSRRLIQRVLEERFCVMTGQALPADDAVDEGEPVQPIEE